MSFLIVLGGGAGKCVECHLGGIGLITASPPFTLV